MALISVYHQQRTEICTYTCTFLCLFIVVCKLPWSLHEEFLNNYSIQVPTYHTSAFSMFYYTTLNVHYKW